MSDESITGLLLRAHAQVAAQAHGEEFIHHNVSAMCAYQQAEQSISSAIQSVARAEMHQFGRDIYGPKKGVDEKKSNQEKTA
jgi:hypothetical protein